MVPLIRNHKLWFSIQESRGDPCPSGYTLPINGTRELWLLRNLHTSHTLSVYHSFSFVSESIRGRIGLRMEEWVSMHDMCSGKFRFPPYGQLREHPYIHDVQVREPIYLTQIIFFTIPLCPQNSCSYCVSEYLQTCGISSPSKWMSFMQSPLTMPASDSDSLSLSLSLSLSPSLSLWLCSTTTWLSRKKTRACC